MSRFKPLVTEDPQGNYQWLHNMTVTKDKEVYLRDFNGEGDLNLVDFCKRECKSKCDIEQEGTAIDFAENMDCACPVSLVYHMAVGHAELRERLKHYEAVAPELLEALERIANPIEFMQKEANESGMRLNGLAVTALSNDPYHLKSIAKRAIAKAKGEAVEP